MLTVKKVVAAALCVMVGWNAVGQEKISAKAERLQTALKDLNVFGTDHWIYNSLDNAVAEAKKTGKPIFVTFRCVPCKACAGFDAEVAQGSEVITKFAKENFISLRQVEMKGVDLTQFQFDYDLNWAAMFISADGLVYGRYGTQSAEGPDAYNSVASLKKAMERVLELHADREKMLPQLRSKRGPEQPYKTGLEMPGMENKEKLAGETVRNNCIHCHMIHDARHNELYKAGKFTMEEMNRYPLPDNVGLHIDRNDGRKVEKVAAGSAAERAGIKAGDEITHMKFVPVISIADMQWAMNGLPNAATALPVTVKRGEVFMQFTVKLEEGWKKMDWSWRGSRWSMKPRPGFWAPLAKEEELKTLGLPEGSKAYRIQFLNRSQDEGRAAYDVGLREGDFIVGIDGKPVTMEPERFHMWVRTTQKIGGTLPLTVVRKGEKKEIGLPLVD